MRNNYFILLIGIGCLMGCQVLQTENNEFLGDKLLLQRHDLVIKDTVVDLNCEVIPLELTDNSALRQIDKVILFEDKIGILDLGLRAFFVYDRQGTFRYEINHIGNGPEEYSRLLDVSLDPVDSGFVFLTSPLSIMFYSFTGEYKDKIKMEDAFQRMAVHGDYIYLLHPDRVNYDKQKYSFMALNRHTGEQKDLLEQGLRPVEPLWTHGYSMIAGKDAVYYLQRFTHQIYKITEDYSVPLYQLNLGKYELLGHLMKENIDRDYFDKETKWNVFSLTNYIEIGEEFMVGSNLPGFFYYEGQKNTIDHIDGIENNTYGIEFQHLIPVEPAGEKIAFSFDEYRIIYMKENLDRTKNKALKDLLNSLPRDSNPVLFLYDLK